MPDPSDSGVVSDAGGAARRRRPRPWLLRVRGPSMTPTYRDGDLLLALRNAPARPGVAVVRLPPDSSGRARPLSVKRIAPAPGEPGRWWVDSDDPRGVDSFSFGSLADEDILGVVLIRLWRPRRPPASTEGRSTEGPSAGGPSTEGLSAGGPSTEGLSAGGPSAE